MTTPPQRADDIIELPATAAAAGMARRELAATPGVAGELGYRALLMATELIAVFVATDEPRPGAVLQLAVAVTDERVRVTVSGEAPAIDPDALLRSRETPSLGGYGLALVDRMAEDWGVVVAGDAAEIWFALAR